VSDKVKSRTGDWFRALAMTPVAMGIVWAIVFLVQTISGSQDATDDAFVFCLFVPGALPLAPVIVAMFHNTPDWIFFLCCAFTVLFYTQSIYTIIRWKRRKRAVAQGLPWPPEKGPVKISYSERWQR